MKFFKDAVTHNGRRCDVVHVDVDNFDGIPDILILKAHAVCVWDNKLLLVNHSEWDIWGIPGGSRDSGESIEQTLIREVQEETNCDVLDYKPIGYQKIISPDNEIHYCLQYLCAVKPIGDFEADPAGNINKIIWINPDDFKKYIEKKEFKEVVIQRAIEILQDVS